MDLLKQAFSEFERTVEKTVTEAASAVVESANEYPKPAAEPVRAVKQLHISAKTAAKQVQSAETSWDTFDWQVSTRHGAMLHENADGRPLIADDGQQRNAPSFNSCSLHSSTIKFHRFKKIVL